MQKRQQRTQRMAKKNGVKSDKALLSSSVENKTPNKKAAESDSLFDGNDFFEKIKFSNVKWGDGFSFYYFPSPLFFSNRRNELAKILIKVVKYWRRMDFKLLFRYFFGDEKDTEKSEGRRDKRKLRTTLSWKRKEKKIVSGI